MTYNFDEIIDRKGTSAYKTDLLKVRFGADDLIPLWVADMDFRSPDFVMEAIRKRAEHEVLGYTIRNKEFFAPIINWIQYKHKWTVEQDWIGFVPGIVPAMAVAVLAFSEPGDKVIIQSPVYPPFFSVVENNKRELAINELLLENGQYQMNFEQLRQLAADPKTKLLLLCSPHNPGGRVWTKDELNQVAEICAANNVLVVSDEIHADLVLPGYVHVPFATVSQTAKNNSITLMAPSKTFNIAGLGTSSFIIPNKDIHLQFTRQLQALEFAGGSIFAMTATTAAYEEGAEWLEQLICYIQGNIELVISSIEEHLPKIKVMRPEASFLIWLDFSAYGMTDAEVQAKLVNEAKLALNPGPTFGPGGAGFHRLNVGCSRIVLQEALQRLQTVFGAL